MRHLLSPITTTTTATATTTMRISSSSSSASSSSSSHSQSSKSKKTSSNSSNPNITNCNNNNNNSSSNNSVPCKHSPSATLDILILILVLFSGTFLLTSYFSYIFTSISLLLPPLSLASVLDSALPYILGFVTFFAITFCSVQICCGYRSRKCEKPRCKGMKKALEFDLQVQTEESLKTAVESNGVIDKLPWKGGTEGNPDYECLRAELRNMAPPNGRAVLLFRASCGCPIAKLEGWGPKRGRRNKKGLALNGAGADRR